MEILKKNPTKVTGLYVSEDWKNRWEEGKTMAGFSNKNEKLIQNPGVDKKPGQEFNKYYHMVRFLSIQLFIAECWTEIS